MPAKRIAALADTPKGKVFTWVVDPEVHCRCGATATHLLTSHLTDCCTPEEQTGTEFMCNACVGSMYQMAAQLLHPSNGKNFCGSCLLPFDSLSAIIVSLIPIPKAGT